MSASATDQKMKAGAIDMIVAHAEAALAGTVDATERMSWELTHAAATARRPAGITPGSQHAGFTDWCLLTGRSPWATAQTLLGLDHTALQVQLRMLAAEADRAA